MSKKKNTPSGVQICDRDHHTTPGVKSEAKRLFEQIGMGADHALMRPKSKRVDRALRILIAKANKSGDCIINNKDGKGYYRPGPADEEALAHYLNAELHRSDEIVNKVYAMKEAYYGRY